MSEETPLPLARMATINKPSFWVFIGACITLYTLNHFYTNGLMDDPFSLAGDLIWGAAFTGLFLVLVTGAIKNEKTKRAFNIVCYVFEVGSVVSIGLLILMK